LQRLDGDLSIYILLPNSVRYTTPVFDPFFFANGSVHDDDYTYPNYDVSMLACVEQQRICNPTTKECTNFGGILPLQNATNEIGLNIDQKATAQRLIGDSTSISESARYLEASGTH
jgi:hypothetical protein